MTKNTRAISLLVIVLFLIIWNIKVPSINIHSISIHRRLTLTIFTLIATSFVFPPKNILKSLGLNKNIFYGFISAFTISSPMLLGALFLFNINPELSVQLLFDGALYAGIYEEIIFRGFLFGILYRFSNWGFIPAAILSAVIFASGHLYQAENLFSALSVLVVTGLGGLWFSWLYIEWDKNLWITIFLHTLMNAYWGIFSMGSNAVGGINGNILRILTILLSIVLTIILIKKRKTNNISKKQLLYNKDSENLLPHKLYLNENK